MASLNSVHLIGRVGQDATMKYTPSGVAVGEFSLATDNSKKNKDGSWADVPPDWHNVKLFGDQAERLCPQMTKGTPVFVEGKVSYRSWEGQDGKKNYRTEIIANRAMVLVKNSQAGSNNPSTQARASQPAFDDDGELPFE